MANKHNWLSCVCCVSECNVMYIQNSYSSNLRHSAAVDSFSSVPVCMGFFLVIWFSPTSQNMLVGGLTILRLISHFFFFSWTWGHLSSEFGMLVKSEHCFQTQEQIREPTPGPLEHGVLGLASTKLWYSSHQDWKLSAHHEKSMSHASLHS